MSYTKGPWHVDGFNLTAVIKNEGSETWPQWKHICNCDYGYASPEKYFEENKANAIIISTAPEAIDLLIRILPHIHDYGSSGIQDTDLRKEVRDIEYEIKRIIKKAKS